MKDLLQRDAPTPPKTQKHISVFATPSNADPTHNNNKLPRLHLHFTTTRHPQPLTDPSINPWNHYLTVTNTRANLKKTTSKPTPTYRSSSWEAPTPAAATTRCSTVPSSSSSPPPLQCTAIALQAPTTKPEDEKPTKIRSSTGSAPHSTHTHTHTHTNRPQLSFFPRLGHRM